MGDTVLYMRSPDGISPQLNDKVIDDLREFVSLQESDFDRSVAALAASQPFLSSDELRTVLCTVLDDEQAKRLARVIRSLHRIDTDGPGIANFTSQLANVELDDKSSVPAFDQEQLTLLKDRVAKLKTSWSALDRQKKAVDLGKATGKRLLGIQLICELRPIFDSNRVTIEGLLPITTMHLVTEGADGLPDSIDVVLSATDIETLVNATGFAKKKLSALRTIAEKLKTPIPTTEISRTATTDAKNS